MGTYAFGFTWAVLLSLRWGEGVGVHWGEELGFIGAVCILGWALAPALGARL